MGWAAGFRAGSELGGEILDTYRAARKNREMKEIEAGIQQQRDDATAEQETQQANIQVMAGQQPGQAQQQQLARNVGLAPAINPQQSMVAPPGQQLAGRATNVPAMGQMSPVGSEAMGLGPAAKGPMSEAMEERERARQLRSLGYTDEANQALDRSLNLEQIEYQRERDTIADARADKRLGFEETRLGFEGERLGFERGREERAKKLFEQQTEVFGYQIADLERKDELRKTIESFAGMSANEIITSPKYQDLSLSDKKVVAGMSAEVTSSELEASNAYIKQQLSALRTDQAVLDFVNQDESITAGTSYNLVENEDGSVSLQYQTDGGEAIGQARDFETESQAINYLRNLVTDPGTAAVYYETVFQGMQQKAAVAAANAEDNRQFALEQITDLQTEFLDPDGVWAQMRRTDPEQFRKVKESVFAPFKNYLSPAQFEELTEQLPDPQSTAGEGNLGESIAEGLSSATAEGTVFDTAVGVPARAVADATTRNIINPVSQLVSDAGSRSRVGARLRNQGSKLDDIATDDLLATLDLYEPGTRQDRLIRAELARRQYAANMSTASGLGA